MKASNSRAGLAWRGALSPRAGRGDRVEVAQSQEERTVKRILRAALALSLASVCVLASAQGYPAKPVRMIVPFAPGGASDFVARIISPKLGELLGQTIVIENKPGASGNIGMEAAAKSPPDGYTIYLGNIGTIAINPAVFPNLSVNPQKDFIAITEVADVPSILIAAANVPASNAV